MLFRAALLVALPLCLAGAQSNDDNVPVFKGPVADGASTFSTTDRT